MKLRLSFLRNGCSATSTAFAAALVASLLLPARAQAAEPTAQDRATARALAAEGHAAFDAKDYETAATRFARADQLVHAPTLMLWLARSQVALGRIVAANESLNRILREDLPANVPKVWTDALDEARRELAKVSPRLSWITVNVKGAAGHEEDLHVLIDGAEIPSAAVGLPRAVDAGKHTVVASVERSPAKSEGGATVAEGQSAAVSLQVTWVPPPPGTPPRAKGMVLANGIVVVQGPVEPYSPVRKYIGFAALGLGGAGIVVGAATGATVISKHSGLAKACPGGKCPASEQSTLDTYNTLGTVSTIGFVAGGVLAVAGVVLVVTAPKQPANQPVVGLQIMPTLGGGALGAVGSF